MNAQTLPSLQSVHDSDFGQDLASLACDAAVELDNLIHDPERAAPSVRQLADRLAQELPETTDLTCPKYLVDASTVVVMSRVISESSLAGQLREMQDLTKAAGMIAQQLMQVSEGSDASRDILTLEQLRSFCLLLSKAAATARQSGTESKPQHPYRKQR